MPGSIISGGRSSGKGVIASKKLLVACEYSKGWRGERAFGQRQNAKRNVAVWSYGRICMCVWILLGFDLQRAMWLRGESFLAGV